jgi:hypothetical protein
VKKAQRGIPLEPVDDAPHEKYSPPPKKIKKSHILPNKLHCLRAMFILI